jgi:hypothetical protein
MHTKLLETLEVSDLLVNLDVDERIKFALGSIL